MTVPVTQHKNIKDKRLSPILKWAGGKEQELKYIHPHLPKKINNYYEPFIGGGAVYLSMQINKMFINDKSHELINLYNLIAKQDKKFFSVVDDIMHNWILLEKIIQNDSSIFIEEYKNYSNNKSDDEDIKNWVTSFVLKYSIEFNSMFDTTFNVNIENFLKELRKNIVNKMKRMKKIELKRGLLPDDDILDNMESALKSAFYMHIRHLYNNIERYNIGHSFAVAIFFFIRNYAYSGMFRYNKNGGFNVPYGGIGYNKKNLSKKINYLQNKELIEHLSKTTIDNLDFEEFFIKNKPKKDDFIFLDPPYDSEFSTYVQNKFTRQDQTRLAKYLIEDCEANWMMIIKNTEFIYSLYDKKDIYITSFDKKYLVSFQNRNNKDARHLIISNYKLC
jgi:DNA adenine methylase